MAQVDEAVRRQMRAQEVDSLKRQCDACKLGQKEIGPRSGCDIKKKLVVDQNEVAWKHKHLFFKPNGECKMRQPIERKLAK